MSIDSALYRFTVILLLLVYGCEVPPTSDETVICNHPYIRHADGCCLDTNSNSICDDDETTQEPTGEESVQVPETAGEAEEPAPAPDADEGQDIVVKDKVDVAKPDVIMALGYEFLTDIPKKIELSRVPNNMILNDLVSGNEVLLDTVMLSFSEVTPEFIRLNVYDISDQEYLFSGKLEYPNSFEQVQVAGEAYTISYYGNKPNTIRWLRSS